MQGLTLGSLKFSFMITVFLRNAGRRAGNLKNHQNTIKFLCSCGTQVGFCEKIAFENGSPKRCPFFFQMSKLFCLNEHM